MTGLTTQQAALRLGVTPSTVKRWAEQGRLTTTTTAGGHRRFSAQDVERLRQQGVAPHGTPESATWVSWSRLPNTAATVAALHACVRENGTWARAAQHLEAMLVTMRLAVVQGRASRVDARVMTERLARALAQCSDAVVRTPAMAPCWLLNAEGEDVVLPLQALEPVVLAAGFDAVFLGRRMALMEVLRAARRQRVGAVVFHASAAMKNNGHLATQLQLLDRTCRAFDIRLVCWGNAPWPAWASGLLATDAGALVEKLGSGHRA